MALCRAQCSYLDWLFPITCVEIKSFRNLVEASLTIDRWVLIIVAFIASVLQTQDRNMSLLTLFGNSKCGGPLARSIPSEFQDLDVERGGTISALRVTRWHDVADSIIIVAWLSFLDLLTRCTLCAVISVEGDGAVDILILDSLLKVGRRALLLHQVVVA